MNALYEHGIERGRTGAWSGSLEETAESR